MSELPGRAIPRTIQAVEWRLARPEDGPVWVALTREGRAPLLPREALTEPSRRLVQDRLEREEDLRAFLAELPRRSGTCFLLWYAGRALGRVCFTIEDNQALMWGLALLPKADEPNLIESVIQSVITHAAAAEVADLLAVFEGSHLPAFRAAGFEKLCRYSTMVAAIQENDDEQDEEKNRQKVASSAAETHAPPYWIRPLTRADLVSLPALQQEFSPPSSGATPAAAIWQEEIAQLMGGQRHVPLPDCGFVAEGYQTWMGDPCLLGSIQVGCWRHVAVISDLSIAQSARKMGIGKALVERVRRKLAQSDYATIISTVQERTSAHRFFRSVGFRDVQQGNVVARYTFS